MQSDISLTKHSCGYFLGAREQSLWKSCTQWSPFSFGIERQVIYAGRRPTAFLACSALSHCLCPYPLDRVVFPEHLFFLCRRLEGIVRVASLRRTDGYVNQLGTSPQFLPSNDARQKYLNPTVDGVLSAVTTPSALLLRDPALSRRLCFAYH